MAATEYTTISCRPEIRDRLRSRKVGGESYADVIERLLEETAGGAEECF